MADLQVSVYVGPLSSGKPVNVYGSYANALAFASTGLSTIYAVTPLTGAKGSAISQTAKTAGLTPDQSNCVHFYAAENAEYFLMSADAYWGLPRRIVSASIIS